ncbi:MFS transporter [Gordonia sp. PP30]|uniref:MFS transporter n=1 Tax=Gordonia sp. PP30 TaxID=2935861 RepID=UPI001FFEBFFB|nr:MFS transporter [Gordonia sp. PP30]UQE73740.1 MFS transporter [Gordonia sp. PP30]
MTAPTSRLPRVLRPFAVRQYRWLAAGLALALFGDGIWLIALVWQVIGLGGGPGRVSLVSGIAAVGMIASTLFGGVLADRVSQRKIVVGLETVKLLAFGSVGIASLLGVLTFGHLAVAALLGGITTGMYYPAYSALLPRVIDAGQLLAANGVEGILRPVLYQAAGPMLAGLIIGQTSPGTAIVVGAIACVLSGACYRAMGPVAEREATGDEKPADTRHPVRAVIADLGEGIGYVRRTPWLWSTLLYACFLILMVMGPIEVLVPFALRDRAGGDASSHSLVLAAFGAGAALGALGFASVRMPRRYLTVMFALWSVCAIPLVIMGFARHTVLFVVAGFLMGLMLDGPLVLWGTLLQRRVPTELLGRVSSLDFFVSGALMPVSMALAAPAAQLIGIGWTFVLAGLLPFPVAVLLYLAAGLWRDEAAHPLATPETDVDLSGLGAPDVP